MSTLFQFALIGIGIMIALYLGNMLIYLLFLVLALAWALLEKVYQFIKNLFKEAE